jgi:hypothetical protein
MRTAISDNFQRFTTGPTWRFKIDFAPFRFDQFASTDKVQRQKLDGKTGDVRTLVYLDLLE